MRLHLFLILALFFHVSLARANPCEIWVSGGGVIVQNLALEGLLETGAAHLQMPASVVERLVDPALPAENEDLHFEVVHELQSQIEHLLLVKLKSVLPGFEVERYMQSGLGGGGLENEWNWHRDNEGHLNPRTPEDIRTGRLNKFYVRVNFPMPINVNPPTVLMPAGGEFKGKPLHGTFDQFTIFITDLVDHSVPIAPEGWVDRGRSVMFFDFLATRK